jgi:hypothetical protein
MTHLIKDRIVYKTAAGSTIYQAAKEAIRLAVKDQTRIEFVFNKDIYVVDFNLLVNEIRDQHQMKGDD